MASVSKLHMIDLPVTVPWAYLTAAALAQSVAAQPEGYMLPDFV